MTGLQSTRPGHRVELHRVVERWEHLEEHTRQTILALVDTEAIGKPQPITPTARKLFDGLTIEELPLFHSWFHDQRGFIQGSPIEPDGGTYRWDGRKLEANGDEAGTWETVRRVIGETTIKLPLTSNPEAQRLFEGLNPDELGFFDRWFFDGHATPFIQGTPNDRSFPQHRFDGKTLQRRDSAGQSWQTIRAVMLEPCMA